MGKRNNRYIKDEWWNGERVLAEEPKRCPKCHSENIELELWNQEDEFDQELAIACGYEGEADFSQDALPYYYVHDEIKCHDCEYRIAYGPRHYLSPTGNGYDHTFKPKTLKELALEELKRQEEAGQMRLPGVK